MLTILLFLQSKDPLGDLPALGIGGAIAFLVFYFYRQDRKVSEDNLTKLAANFRQVVEANTQAITKLTVLVGDQGMEEVLRRLDGIERERGRLRAVDKGNQ